MTSGGDPHDPHDPDDPLGREVWALFRALDHAGDPPAPAAASTWLTGEAGREQDGTRVRFALQLDGRRVIAARFRAYGCPHTLAACEWLARQLTGCELDARSPAGLARGIGDPLEWSHRLAIPAAKLGCLLVIEDALRAALASG
ncbi:MAG TPA: iron-sulfur cluster assembly scaffold protein [Steroidobacteraceae bacterium]|jgi:NifU-like protein involved in Fe-S cluster formation|nr:iron-sulfur cluster assembly scaffold protein [Steroidobacteraceae bacterium]